MQPDERGEAPTRTPAAPTLLLFAQRGSDSVSMVWSASSINGTGVASLVHGEADRVLGAVEPERGERR